MSDLPDPSLWRLLEHIGPWVGNAAGVIAGFIAWLYNGLKAQMKETNDKLQKLSDEIPKTYATKEHADGIVKQAMAEMKDHVDTIRTDVRTLHGDVKDLLKMLANRQS